MARSGNQKRKILYLERMMEETEVENPITMREMIRRLADAGIQAERKSIYDDLEELRAVGMEIIFRKAGPAGYYWKRETAADQEDGHPEYEEREGGYREVQLRFRKGCLESVRRRYGENLKILKQEGKQIQTAVPEIPGPEFYGWLTGQEGGVRLCKPKDAVKEYRRLLKKVLENYK